jgi:hypothetical protein
LKPRRKAVVWKLPAGIGGESSSSPTRGLKLRGFTFDGGGVIATPSSLAATADLVIEDITVVNTTGPASSSGLWRHGREGRQQPSHRPAGSCSLQCDQTCRGRRLFFGTDKSKRASVNCRQ